MITQFFQLLEVRDAREQQAGLLGDDRAKAAADLADEDVPGRLTALLQALLQALLFPLIGPGFQILGQHVIDLHQIRQRWKVDTGPPFG